MWRYKNREFDDISKLLGAIDGDLQDSKIYDELYEIESDILLQEHWKEIATNIVERMVDKAIIEEL